MPRVILFILFSVFVVGCSTAEKKPTTPEGMLARAKEFENDDRFEEAIRRYQELRSKFPYSSQALEAELAVADVYYKQESYPEAQTAYQSFKDLHPKHAKNDYVYYRVALSLYNQLPETIDRDLSLVPDTILAFNELLKRYPQAEYVKDSQEKRTELIRKLAEKEMYIADFYFNRKTYLSALPRYEYVLKEYQGIGYDEKALARAAYSAYKLGDPNKARKYSTQLKANPIKDDSNKSLVKEIKL